MSYADIVLDDGPAVLLLLNEASGASFADSSGHGHTATLTGSATYEAGPVLPSGEISGLRISGTANYLSFSSGVNYGPGQALTLECWVVPNSLNSSPSATNGLVGTFTDTSHADFMYLQASNGDPNFFCYGGGADEYAIASKDASGTPYNVVGGIHHLVVTIDTSNVARWYLDGVAVYTKHDVGPSYPGTPITAPPGGVSLSNRYSGGNERVGYLGGYGAGDITIGCVAVYPTVLTAAQVVAHYQAGLRGGVSY